MYVPQHFSMPDADVRALLAAAETAQLITAHGTGPVATLLPYVWRPGDDGFGSLFFHVTRTNPVWRDPGLGDALAIVSGPDGYIHPPWYALNEQDPGVPTWNYVTVHAYGKLVVHDDLDWALGAALEVSDRHGYDSRPVGEQRLRRMARAIVGLELPIARVEAKAKLNQNRAVVDIEGAVAALRAEGNHELAAEMERVAVPHARAREALVADVRTARRPFGPSAAVAARGRSVSWHPGHPGRVTRW